MKKLLLSLTAMIAMVATSCVQADVEDINLGEEGIVTFKINAPGISSRAAINDGTGATVLTYAIYDDQWKYLSQTTIEDAFASNLTEVISLRLVKNKTYNFVFWAQHPNATCYTLSLGTTVGAEVAPTVEVSYDGAQSNDDTRDAFFGQLTGLKVDGTVNETVILTRPFAQINFATNHEDTRIAEAAGYKEVENVTTLFKTRAYTSLNLADGGVAGETDVTFDFVVNPSDSLVLLDKSNSYDWLAMNYILVPANESSLSTCSMTAKLDGQEDITIEYPMAPAKRNWRTNLVGNLLTEQAVIEVKIDPVPEGEIIVDYKDGRLVSTAQDLVAAIAAAPAGVESKIKLEEDIVLTETLVIPADKIITINFNGHSVTTGDASGISTLSTRADAASTYAFNNHGTLTLNGGVISARGIYNGYNTEGGENYTSATIVVNGTTINALGEDGGAGIFNYGVTEINNGTFTGYCGVNNQTGGTMTIKNIAVAATNRYGIQNNGGTLVVENGSSLGGVYCNGGDVTIKNGTFSNSVSGRHVLYAYNTNLVIEGGNFHNENKGNATVYVGGASGKATINGGTYTIVRGSDWTSCLIDSQNESTLTVNGGDFKGALRSYGAGTTINGGTWEDVHSSGFNVNSNVKVAGGTFVGTSAQNFAKNNQDTACTLVTNEDGSVTVKQAPYYTDANGNYYITSAEGLNWVSEQVNTMELYVSGAANIFDGKTVYLTRNINLGGAEWRPIGDYAFSRTSFNGVFDGQNYTVSNFKVTEPVRWTEKVTEAAYGLFGNVKGTIKNLTVENATVAPQGGRYSAALVGRLHNGGVIENCHVVNSSATILHWQVGALVGQNNNGNISNCSVVGSTVTGKAAVGAIVGMDMAVGEHTIANCRVANTALVQNESFGASYDASYGLIVGLVNVAGITLHIDNAVVEDNTIKGVAAETLVGDNEAGATVLVDGVIVVATADELTAAVASNVTVAITADIEGGSLKLPANLSNFTLRAANGATLKNFTISAADGNAYHYENLTFDGITFDNSRIVLTGWRNGDETLKNLTITNCVFTNINDTTNNAAVHINKDAAEAVENFTFTNNVINGVTGGSKSGVYAQLTGKVVFENNVINNVSFRPYVIQITTDDGIADSFSVKGNTFSGSSVGRAQGLGNNDAGTDAVQLVVSGNIFKDITGAQQICYWNFNAATTTADLSKNYYSIDIEANPSGIYYNRPASSVEDLKEMGVYPFYTELNADGTINLNSLKQAE